MTKRVPSILIADDDPSLLAAVSLLLEASGYVVETTGSTAETLERWPRTHPDLVIVDLHMPGGGMELVRAITRKTSIPVIVLSADDQASVKVAALDAGAEDYITKPFAATELLARIRVALRRRPSQGGPITVGRMTLSEADLSVSLGAASVKLTPTEFDLLKTMAVKGGFVMTADLLHDVWGPAYSAETDYVRVYMRRLRAKLDSLGAGNAIESRPGLGYRLTVGADPASSD
ncbi:MAG TPA: response regulator transcription factor [Acidimicrobiia bacterium]|nr:response regulator transcription factor [Acidimicrobiia bacterium]